MMGEQQRAEKTVDNREGNPQLCQESALVASPRFDGLRKYFDVCAIYAYAGVACGIAFSV